MNSRKAKKIRRQMKKMGFTKDLPQMQTHMLQVGSRKHMVKVPAKTLLGKAVKGAGMKTEFIEVPILQAFNPYKKIFKSIVKGTYDFKEK